MEAIAAGVAVVGTLLGVLLQHRFQRQGVAQASELTRLDRLRQERLTACAEFAGSLATYRRSQIDRWYARHQNAGSPVTENEQAVRRQRDITQEALFRVQLLSDSDEVVNHAESVFLAMNAFKPAKNRAEVEKVRDSTHEQIRDFVRVAGRHLEPTASR